jgi:hypothetical protein
MDYCGGSVLVARARGKTKRVLLRAPIVNKWSTFRYLARLGRHAENLPWLTQDRFDLVAELRQNGIAMRDATTIFPPAVLEVADRLVSQLRNSATPESCVEVSLEDLAANPAIYTWGLNDENLDLAEYHIGLPVQYMGAGVRLERADGIAADTRQWHIDVEDRRMLKIIVYLNDVDEGGGPFEYVNLRWTDHAVRALSYISGFVPDSAMVRVVPTEEWIRATGPRLSAIFVDTSRVFHRAKPPTSADRYSMTFSYSSTSPYQTLLQYRQSRAALTEVCAELTPRQQRAMILK